MRIILGSASPRRKELLQSLGYDFTVVNINCDEVYPESLRPKEVTAYLSLLKSEAYSEIQAGEILITADTIVVLEDEILGKPKNLVESMEMLMKLSGKIHTVYTSFTVRTDKESVTTTDFSKVEFGNISEKEARYYIENYSPLDKAGSYGIQDWLGLAKIKSIQGSFYTVMGLPTHLLHDILSQIVSK